MKGRMVRCCCVANQSRPEKKLLPCDRAKLMLLLLIMLYLLGTIAQIYCERVHFRCRYLTTSFGDAEQNLNCLNFCSKSPKQLMI
jgi:hypothetical protein